MIQTKEKREGETVRGILAVLHKWGIHTCGDFVRLDKEEIRARLGRAGLRLWERARGKSKRFLRFVQPPESFIENFEFEYEVETAEPLLFILRRFLQQLVLRLNGVYLVAQELVLRIHFSNRQIYERRFQIPAPSNEVELLFRILQTHLEDFKADHTIVAVGLEAYPARPLPQQFGLFETSLRNPNRLYETLARLSALLGSDRLGRPVMKNTHRPDAFHLEPFTWELLQAAVSSTDSSPRPALRRFRPSLPASVLLDQDQPIHFQAAEFSGRIAETAGPYRASGNWWDETNWSREEWDLERESGMIGRFHSEGEKWEMDGIYD